MRCKKKCKNTIFLAGRVRYVSHNIQRWAIHTRPKNCTHYYSLCYCWVFCVIGYSWELAEGPLTAQMPQKAASFVEDRSAYYCKFEEWGSLKPQVARAKLLLSTVFFFFFFFLFFFCWRYRSLPLISCGTGRWRRDDRCAIWVTGGHTSLLVHSTVSRWYISYTVDHHLGLKKSWPGRVSVTGS